MNKFNREGQRHGPWEEYHDNGKLWVSYNYINGKLNGYSESYYVNGLLMNSGNYLNDEKHGCWSCFYVYGFLIYKQHYTHGKATGLTIYYGINFNYNKEKIEAIQYHLT